MCLGLLLVLVNAQKMHHYRSADKPDQEGNKLQRPNSNFRKPLKKYSEGFPSKQVFAAAMTSASDEEYRPFNCFFQSGRAKDLSAPLCLALHPHVYCCRKRQSGCRIGLNVVERRKDFICRGNRTLCFWYTFRNVATTNVMTELFRCEEICD